MKAFIARQRPIMERTLGSGEKLGSLSAPLQELDGLFVGHKDIDRRLLEANLSGVETGAGAVAPDPVGSGLYALVDTVDVTGLEADDFRLRVVDFMLYVEYWRAEGIGELRAAMRREKAERNSTQEAVVVRA